MDLLANLETKYQLPNGLLNAVMQTESGGNNNAVSPKGARGAFQFIPATAKQYGVDTSNFNSSADGSARMFSDLQKAHNGNLDKMLASYNFGQGNVAKNGMDNLPKETQDYIVKVKSRMQTSDNAWEADPIYHAPQTSSPSAQPAQASTNAWEADPIYHAPQTSAASSPSAPEKDGSMTLKDMQAASRGNADVNLKDVAGGLYRGALNVGGGLAMPLEYAYDKITGNKNTHDERVNRIDDKFAKDYNTNSNTYKNSRTVGEIAATLPVGGVLGAGADVAGVPFLANALRSGGMTLGADAVPALSVQGAKNAITRIAGGIGNGAVTDALINNGGNGEGAAIGGALPIVTKLAGSVGKTLALPLKYLTDNGQNNMIIDNILKLASDKQGFIDKLKSAKGSTVGFNPTAGQAGGSHEVASFERSVQQSNPALFQGTVDAQNLALVNASKGLGADESMIESMLNTRNSATKELRDTALNASESANKQIPELNKAILQKQDSAISALQQQGKWSTEAAQQKQMSNNFYPVLGYPRIAPQYSNNAQRVPEYVAGAQDAKIINSQRKSESNLLQYKLDSIGEHGLSELKPDSIINSIDATLKTPGLRSSDVVNNSLSEIKDKLTKFTDENGNIHPQDLYTIRKEVGDVIANHAKDTNNWDKKLTSGLERKIQLAIDTEIEKSAGGGWQQYLDKYKELSKPIDQANLGNAIHEKFVPAIYRGEDSPVFKGGANSLNIATLAKTLNNKEVGTNLAKHVTGYSGATLENSLSPNQYKTLKNIVSDTEFINYGKTAGSNGGSQTAQLLSMNAKGENDGLLTYAMKNGSLPMRAIQAIKDFGVKPIEQKTAYLLQNPTEMAKLLDSRLSKADRSNVLVNLLTKNAKLITPIAVSGQSK